MKQNHGFSFATNDPHGKTGTAGIFLSFKMIHDDSDYLSSTIQRFVKIILSFHSIKSKITF